MSDVSDDENDVFFGEEFDIKMKRPQEPLETQGLKKHKHNPCNDVIGLGECEDTSENLDFVEPCSKPNRELESLHASTLDVKQFCMIIKGFKSIPNLELVLLKFTKEGMAMYAKTQESPAIVIAFWNREKFSTYKCDKDVQKWISIKRCEELSKRISKNVDELHIRNIVGDEPGFVFSADQKENEGSRVFTFNVYEYEEAVELCDLNGIVYDCQIMTNSKSMSTSIEFISDNSEFVNFELKNNKLIFQGFGSTGRKGEDTCQNIYVEEDKVNETKDITYRCILQKKYLKIVQENSSLHETLNLHLQVEKKKDDILLPLLFSYTLDTRSPQSHLSIYILPKARI